MKIQRVKIATLALSACMALGVVCFAACGVNGKSAYEIWLEQGNTGTEQEFLNSLKGTNGVDGKDGKDGTNGTNGKDGVDGTNGKDGVDGTNGKDGTNGTNGKDGATWHYGEGEPLESLGNEGDLYLDYTAWDVYAKKSTGWEKLGSMKGESEPAGETAIKDYGPITLGAGDTQDLSLDGIEEGAYYLVAETDSAAQNGVLTAEDPFAGAGSGGTKYTYDMYSPANGGEYRSVVFMKNGGTADTKTVLKNDSGSKIKLNSVKLLKFDLEIQAGKELVVPVLFFDMSETKKLQIPISEELIGKKVKITCYTTDTILRLPQFLGLNNTAALFNWASGDQVGDTWVKEVTLPEQNYLTIRNRKEYHINLKIKIELAET